MLNLPPWATMLQRRRPDGIGRIGPLTLPVTVTLVSSGQFGQSTGLRCRRALP